MTIETVIFDFDGTIADSLRVVLSVAEDVFDVDRAFDDSFVHELRGMSQSEILEALDISMFQALLHWKEGKEEFADRVEGIDVFDGVKDALHDLDDQYDLGILTNNDEMTVRRFIDHHDLPSFQFIEDSFILSSKANELDRLVTDVCDGDVSEVVYVGDQVSDVEAAYEVGCAAIAVTWGYNSDDYLEEVAADQIIAHPSELVSAVQSL